MKKLFLLLALGAMMSNSLLAHEMGGVYFRIVVPEKKAWLEIERHATIMDFAGDTLLAHSESDAEFDQVRRMGYDFQIVPDPTRAPLAITMATTVEQMANWDRYPTYEVYTQMLQQMAQEHSSICRLETIGTTVQGRHLLALKISDNPDQQENEAEFFFTGQMHGDELVGGHLYLHLAHYLVNEYGQNELVNEMVDGLEIWINPLANPDGTYHGGNHTVAQSTRQNQNGVDLNRNFPDPQGIEHPDGNAYQPETQAMMDFAAAHTFTMSGNSHSGAEVINYPWDTWSRLHPDDNWLQRVSRQYADAAQAVSTGYLTGFNNGITNGYAWYSVQGGRQDYMNFFHHCREITFELSEVKLLGSEQMPAHWNYNRDAMLGYIRQALFGVGGLVTAQDNGEALRAKVEVLNHDMDNTFIYTDPDVGDYHRPIFAGTYDLRFSCPGFASKTIEDVQVAHDQLTQLDVQLIRHAILTVSGNIRDGETELGLVGATVKLEGEGGSFNAQTNDQGAFSLTQVPSGEYQVTVLADGYYPVMQTRTLHTGSTQIDISVFPGLVQDFEVADLDEQWKPADNAGWSLAEDAYNSPVQSLRSGSISNSQTSSVEYELNALEGVISFYFKVSSENGYDYLRFFIDGQQQQQWSGEQGWTRVQFPVSAGNHTFRWSYVKDYSQASGQDGAWLDDVMFPPSSVVAIEEPTALAARVWPNPFTDELHFLLPDPSAGGFEVELFDATGRLLDRLSSDGNALDWDARHLPDGPIFYRITQGQTTHNGHLSRIR